MTMRRNGIGTGLLISALICVAMAGTIALTTRALPHNVMCFFDRQQFESGMAKLGQRQIGRGINLGGAVIDIFSNEDGLFTIAAQRPGGLVCPFFAGTDWEIFTPQPGQEL